ncbi:MAG: peptidoglycan bridge formation glycyltransferase FemA/FemB family protein [Anaerolineae bacterium]|nr:peptidoglycan bridge formation glycyltransferase FemA/FemB family protein [Anaerolineae bacterium]
MSTTVLSPTPETWDSFVEAQSGHFLQTSRWGEIKRTTANWEYDIIALEENGQLIAGALMLYWQAPLGLGTIAYVARGPVIDWNDDERVVALLHALDAAARRHRAIMLKVEPHLEDTPEVRERLAGFDLTASTHNIQPKCTILIDLGGTEEGVQARMNQGTRRKIRTAGKRDVKIRHGKTEDIDSFYELTAITAQRDKIAIRSLEYHRKLFDLFAPNHATLIMASYQDRDLGGILVLALGKHAWYLYGASSNEERERMPNYAVQWEAIRWARERGCTEYDLWGIPDEDEQTLEAQFQHRRDGLWGVYGFKRGFGGRVWQSVGAWDRPYNPLLYAVYKIAAAIRDWWRARMNIVTSH